MSVGGRSKHAFVAVDLGAGSGRFVLGCWDGETLSLRETYRFQHQQHHAGGRLRWSFAALMREIEAGLVSLGKIQGFKALQWESIGVDTWGVDYGLLDSSGRLLEDPVSYRDARTENMLERLLARVPRAEVYRRTGIQFLPFNTLVQVFAQLELQEWPHAAKRLLLIPDLVHLALSGVQACERSNASTTQMLNADSGEWDRELVQQIGLDPSVLPPLIDAPARLGTLQPALAARCELPRLTVVAPATHDTASAVAGTPLQPGWAYISSGTWSLVGIELPEPILSEGAARCNFTNERGVFATTRLLKNVMGLWILERCREEWRAAGVNSTLAELLDGLEAEHPGEHLLDPDDMSLLAPASMEAAARAAIRGPRPGADLSRLELVRAILVSLALRYAAILDQLAQVAGIEIVGIHIVGGGSQNAFLNQATASPSGLGVLAGPVEATAIGNLLLQAISAGAIPNLASARATLCRSVALRPYSARPNSAWESLKLRMPFPVGS